MDNKIDIFKSNDGIEIHVTLEQDTVWLDAHLIAKLFGVQRPAIVKHIGNIYKTKELKEKSTCSKKEQVASDGKLRKMKLYNLDMIISVGYRVNSSRATQFRQWANNILKDYLVQGYAINQKRLEQKEQEVKLLKDGIHILTRTVSKAIEEKASDNIILETFAKGLSLLDDYDHEQLDVKGLTTREVNYPSLDDYQELISQMLTEFDSEVFGKEKDKSFESAVAQIEKGFGDNDFYPSLEEKATMLLYFVVKNHAFVDGNKRIAAACFLKFLQENNMLFNSQQQPIISNDTLASLTLFIASSKPEEMQTVTRLVISVLNRNHSN
ncbi:virulence protein RhuM/Fic/DOC family protein [Mariniflexile litorale]|uniref:Virulence protein RhuM/Fic/DOC family protein n=1 Tax=Mariniflexile litorale TaxID=3045158 RepID=A0AAU7ECL1_9FLAO|nr:virulence protein RhuM/Fic/DOC family protein [Mariniflexile sp. KMM 9835]MDQ8212326.1 virulence protein RhuM/Fic/DOC family protein [Mariniflexile sp. KMM 9835]